MPPSSAATRGASACWPFATPILSTVLLLVTTGQPLQWNVAVAAVLVVGAALWGSLWGSR
jgi:hypothetical protein